MQPEDLAAAARDGPRPQRAAGAADRRATSRRRTRWTGSSPSTARSSRARETLDDVIEQLADRMAAMQSLMRSLSPGAARRSSRTRSTRCSATTGCAWDLAQLAANLDQLLPGGLGERVRFNGDQPLGLEAALEQLGRLQALDQLEAQLDGAGGPGDLGEIDRRGRPRPARAGRRPRPRRARGPRRPARAGRLPRARRRPPGADPARQPADRPEGPRRAVRAAPARRVRRPPAQRTRGAAASARRRPSRSSSATRSTSTCGRRWATRCGARRTRRAGGTAGTAPSSSGPTTSRSTAPSTRPRRRPCCSST